MSLKIKAPNFFFDNITYVEGVVEEPTTSRLPGTIEIDLDVFSE